MVTQTIDQGSSARDSQTVARAVLSIIADSRRDPVGSSVIHHSLLGQGFRISEPTIGRILRNLDRDGYTTRVSNRGRIITEQGENYLIHLLDSNHRGQRTQELVETIRFSILDDISDVLIARRGLEREIARAAANLATPQQIEDLKRHVERKEAGLETVGIHEILAEASHNRVLASALDLIRGDPELRRILNEVLQEQDKFIDATFNHQIIEAIERRDPDAAEQAVINHLDSVLEAVQRYYDASNVPGSTRKTKP